MSAKHGEGKVRFQVVGQDRFSYENFSVGEYDSMEEAVRRANEGATEAMINATSSDIADSYYVIENDKIIARGHDFARIARALDFATKAHSTEIRKGTKIPYIVHPLDVFSILLKNDANDDLAIAGILHDVLEDTDASLAEIERQFGRGVARLVKDASEPPELTRFVSDEEKRKNWKQRKADKIEKMKHASGDLRLLVCADKLANIRDIQAESNNSGEKVWTRFNASKEDESWYYNSMVHSLGNQPGHSTSIADTVAYKELAKTVRDVFRTMASE